ncbi:hypothetical protein RB195_011737 [Necator americanus]|uniref:CCHC-type domain-containing protein n=1 Tax=Necator americanus TaxID=51031 RepID=A0ABR1D3V6_NECAM
MKTKKLCHNCGANDHIATKCPRGSCRVCGTTGHHTSICKKFFDSHSPSRLPPPVKLPEKQSQPTKPTTRASATPAKVNLVNFEPTLNAKPQPNTVLHVNDNTEVMILAGQAQVLNPESAMLEPIYVMLDTGAVRSFISNELAKRLQLKDVHSKRLTISTFGSNAPLLKTCGITALQMWDANGAPHTFTVTRIDKVTESLQHNRLCIEDKRFLCDNDLQLSINPLARDIQLAPPHRSNINSGAHRKIREVVVRLPSQRLVKRPVNLLVSLELDDKGSSTEEISKKLKSEEQTSTEPSHQRDQSDRDTPVLRTAQQPNNRYDLRPRQKINYTKKKEDTEPIARINKIMEASTLLQVSLMLSLGVTILASKSEVIKETIRSIQCVPGGVHLISPDRIPYEVCAENYCVQFDNPRVDENISFPPDIIFRYLGIRCIIEHLVQWKFGEKLNTIETLCHPSSLCQAITYSFCPANIFNPERWPISAILGTATLLYFLITGCYVLLYVPLVIGKPIRMVAHILFGFCSTTAGSDDVKLPTKVDRDSTAEIIAISLIAIIPAAKQCQLINIVTDRSTICTNNGFGPCQIELSEVFKINPFKREACLKITRNDTSIHEVRLQWKSLLLNCEPETDMFTRDTVHKVVDSKRCPRSGSCTENSTILASENYTSTFARLSRIREIKDIEEAIASVMSQIHRQIKLANALDAEWKQHGIQSTCSASGGGEQILPINRFLGTACVTKEKLLGITQQYVLLKAMLRIKSEGLYLSPLLNLKGENIQRKAGRTLHTLDIDIRDMECELALAEKMYDNERGSLAEVTDQLTRIEQPIRNMTPQAVLSSSSQPSIGQTAEKDASRGNEENMTGVHDLDHYHSAIEAAEVDDKEIDDRYLELLFAETAMEQSADAIPSLVRPDRRKQRKPCQQRNQTIKVMRKDLDDLRFGFTYLPRRKIGESSTGALSIGQTTWQPIMVWARQLPRGRVPLEGTSSNMSYKEMRTPLIPMHVDKCRLQEYSDPGRSTTAHKEMTRRSMSIVAQAIIGDGCYPITSKDTH